MAEQQANPPRIIAPEFQQSVVLVHGVGVRCDIWEFYPRWQSYSAVLKKEKLDDGTQFTLEHEGTIFYINATSKPNVFFHVSVPALKKDDAMTYVVHKALRKTEWLMREAGLYCGIVNPVEENAWHFDTTYMTTKELERFDEPFGLPGELTAKDVKRFTKQYPGAKPRPVRLDQGFNEDLKQQIIAIIHKYNDGSFEEICREFSKLDESGTCAEICNDAIDGGNPDSCPAKDFRELVRILSKAMPHEKLQTCIGGYY